MGALHNVSPSGKGSKMADVMPGAPEDAVTLLLEEIEAGGGLRLSEAGRLFPAHRGKGSINPSTIFRWVVQGVKTPDGHIVRLAAIRAGARWLTARGAVSRFCAALTAASVPTPTAPPPRTPAERSRASQRATKQLIERGA